MDKLVLKNLGLTDNETTIYLTLLKSGSVTVNKLAEKSGLHRQAIYDGLERLSEKGFVSYVLKNGKKNFEAIEPERILDFLKEKENSFRLILPELISLSKTTKDDTFVEVYKGKDVVVTLYRDIIRNFEKKKGTVLIFGVEEQKFVNDNRTALMQYLRRLRELGCKERILLSSKDTFELDGKQTDYRYLDKKFFSPTPIYVYGKNLVFLTWANPNFAIIIRSEVLADSYKKQFELLWSVSKKK